LAWRNAARSGACPLSEALLELGKTIYAMANAGELKALKIGGQWRMRKIGMMGFAWLGACGAPVEGLEPLLDLECSPMQIELYAEVGGADSTVVHCPSARVAATDVSVTGSSSIQVRDVEPAGADVTRIVVQFTPADLQPPVHAAILEVAPRVGRVATVSVMGTVRSAGAPEIWVPETVDVIPPAGLATDRIACCRLSTRATPTSWCEGSPSNGTRFGSRARCRSSCRPTRPARSSSRTRPGVTAEAPSRR
jgi:hypothetical protein